jgi:hypothetical protein
LTQGLVVASRLRKAGLACAAVVALGLLVAIVLGVTFLVQLLSTEPETKQLVQQTPPAGSAPGRIVLSLSSAAVTVRAGPAGGPLRVESSFDPDVHRLEHSYDEDGSGGWTYRLDFHEKKWLHVSVVSVWLGKRSPEVTIEIPRDLPIALETKMEGGYLSLDLAGLDLTTAGVELDRGVLGLIVSEPLDIPMERLSVKGRMGTMFLRSLGNASPKELDVQHGIGAARVDLSGAWLRDAEIDFQVAFGDGELKLPDGVNIEGLSGAPLRPPRTADEEIPLPTLRVSTHFDIGDIRVVD